MERLKFIFLFCLLCIASFEVSAQSEVEKTKAEIREAFGTIPSFLEAVPDNMLPMAWEHFNSSNLPSNEIPPKYMELIKIAVAAQIPCQYCIHAHEVNAKAAGASDQEVKEAIMAAAWVRQWSTLAQSTTMSMVDFRDEYARIVEYLSGQADR